MRVIFGIFPLLAIPVIIYNMIAFTAGGGVDANGVTAVARGTRYTLPAWHTHDAARRDRSFD